jgi:hypothetical protein
MRKIQTHSPAWRGFYHLTDPFYIFFYLFSDLAIENTELLPSVASALKNLSTLLVKETLLALVRDSFTFSSKVIKRFIIV